MPAKYYYNSVDCMLKPMSGIPFFAALISAFLIFSPLAYPQNPPAKGAIDVNAEIKKLRNKNPGQKISAALKLGKSKDKNAVSSLVKQFKSEKKSVREGKDSAIADEREGRKIPRGILRSGEI